MVFVGRLLVGVGVVFCFGPAVEQHLGGSSFVEVHLQVVRGGFDFVQSLVEIEVERFVLHGGEVPGLGLLRHVLPLLPQLLVVVGFCGLLLLGPLGPVASLGHPIQYLVELLDLQQAELLFGLAAAPSDEVL